jgi:DNA-binding sugar fermentation-stimulating protein
LFVSMSSNADSKTKCTAQIAECTDSEGTYYVGVHPMISQKAAEPIIQTYYNDYVWKSEVFVEEGTRLDFVGDSKLHSGKKMYIEVKNAMISHQCDTKARYERCAIFPDGFRKKKTDPISPRAIKHAETLARLAKLETTDKCMLLYIVPRNDCSGGLELNKTDPAYCKAVRDAIHAGVIVRVFALDFRLDGSIHLFREIPFYLDFV